MKKSILLFPLFIPMGIFAQSTYTVDNDPTSGANYISVQTAIDAAQAGDTIYIHPSVAGYGNFTINKTIHLRGVSHNPEYNSGAVAGIDIITLNAPTGAPNSSISGLQLNKIAVTSGAQNYSGLSITNNDIRNRIDASNTANTCNNWYIAGNRFYITTFEVINKQNSTLHHNWMIVNNFIQQNATSSSWSIFKHLGFSDIVKNNIVMLNHTGSGSNICSNCSSAKIENSIILFKGNSTGVATNEMTYNNCLSYSYAGQILTDLPGANNLNNTDPGFVNDGGTPDFGYGKDFHITAASPAYAHGNDGQQLGLFGNSFPFSMRGYPIDLPYIKSYNSASTVTQGGTLNIQLEAVGN